MLSILNNILLGLTSQTHAAVNLILFFFVISVMMSIFQPKHVANRWEISISVWSE
jgi:hypothetical protein